MTYPFIPNLVGRRVLLSSQEGEIKEYRPLGSSMCDVLVRESSGRECWHASHTMRFTDGSKLPNRTEIRKKADEAVLSSLEGLQRDHQSDQTLWAGKDIIGRSIDGAVKDVKKRLGRDS